VTALLASIRGGGTARSNEGALLTGIEERVASGAYAYVLRNWQPKQRSTIDLEIELWSNCRAHDGTA
jgi:hypothetical protein